MQVFLLLDQDIRPLKVYPLAGKGTRPVEVVPVGDVPQDVEKSFYAATLATYNLLMKNGGEVNNSIFAYELDDDTAKRVYGGSGALAFAVACMHEMLGRDCGETIGATGAIDVERGSVEKIGAINEKVVMAVESSVGLTLLLYPVQNDSEIDPALKMAAREKGIRLEPVKTLQDVRNALIGQECTVVKPQVSSKPTARVFLAVIALFALYLVYGFSSHLLAGYLLENEFYSFARWHLCTAGRIAFFNTDAVKIANEFVSPLETQPIITVRYADGKEESYPVDRTPPEFRLGTRDVFSFKVDPLERVFVYMVQTEESGAFLKLFPSIDEPGVMLNPTWIPGTGVFFRLHGKTGNRDVYIVLSRWRCRMLEKALSGRSGTFQFPSDMARYRLEEQSIQVKRVSMLLSD